MGDTAKNEETKTEGSSSSSAGTAETTFTVTVNGKPVTMTREEVLTKASEATGAQAKFQEAAEMKKQAEKGIRLMALSEVIRSGNPNQADLREFMTLMGADASQLDMDGLLSGQEPPAQEPPSARAKGQQEPKKPVSMADLEPGLRQTLVTANQTNMRAIRESIETTMQEVLDKDPIISKMRDNLSEDKAAVAQFQQEVFDMALESVRGEVFGGRLFDATMAQEIAQRMRGRLKNMGFSETAKAYGIPVAGPGPGTGIFPQGTIPSKPIERISSTDDKYIDNVVQRALQKQAASLRGQKLSR